MYRSDIAQLMPKRRAAWSAWNYLTTSSLSPSPTSPSGSLQTVSLTYNMNILQHIPYKIFSDVLVTLNPEKAPSPSLTQASYEYRHPLFNSRMILAQDQLEDIQGKGGIWYAGAWTGYGFHEDGCRSGIAVGQRLGGDVPWDVIDAKFMRGYKPTLEWKDLVLRLLIRVLQSFLYIAERILGVKRYAFGSKGARHTIGYKPSDGKVKPF